ncbi:prephenate dehydratase [Hahella ganghwensis]|uniref:prephenate dehydratase n=1 Tax=Hahella ganghwensis TaxID=286420 RepID=UPI00037F9F30|nr:prephenate dehydratase [Hahella ganghwensis]
MANEKVELSKLRDRIDQIDRQLLELISERARCAQSVAEVKLSSGSQGDVVFYRPEREAQVLRKVMELNSGPLSDEEVARLFREVMSACLALENPLHIAYLGPEGTFTHAAALKHFGHSVVTLPHAAIDEVFREVDAGTAHYGVVPVETSSEGMINHTLDVFVNSPLNICGEVQIRTHYHLLISPVTQAEDVEVIYSQASSLASCRQWLDEKWPGAQRVAVSSHEEAVTLAAKQKNAAAIAGEHCIGLFGVKSLAGNIEDRPNQVARFLVIGRESIAPSGNDRTSVLITIKDEPGALYRMLGAFYKHSLSLTRLDSRPALSGEQRYHFFIDFSGHWHDENVVAAIQELSSVVLDVRHLGSYPLGVL